MQRRAGGDARVIVWQLRAEVQAFLEVGLPARQLAAHREVPAPRVASQLHPDGEFRLERVCKDLPAERLEASLQCLFHAVADDVEKAGMTAGCADRLGSGRSVVAVRGERGNIDDRKGVHGHRIRSTWLQRKVESFARVEVTVQLTQRARSSVDRASAF